MGNLLHNPLTLFVAQVMVIIALARLVGLLARRIGQPLVIAEVSAGILLGPSLLGWLSPTAMHTLFPDESLPLLNVLSQVGLIFFMFLIGLELDPKLLRGRGHSSVAISHTSIVLPFALGAILALYLYPRLADSQTVRFSSFTLFMGAAMSITAFPVLARILSERQLLKTPVGAVAIACAAVDDVTAWCILAFVVSIVRSQGMADAVQTTILALLYIVLMAYAVRPFLARLGARAGDRETLSQNVVAVTFLLLLLSGWTTEHIGIHALFGAFMMGAIMPREGGFSRALAEKLEDFVVVFLLPLFFAYSGLRTQINLLNSPETWLQCGLIILVACAGKFGGSAAAARLTGMPWSESCAIGVLMNTRGLMELIVLNIGLDLGVISPTLFTMMVLMALVTTFITTPLLHWIYPLDRMKKAMEESPLVSLPPEPAPPTAIPATPAAVAAEPFTVLMCVAKDLTGPGMAVLSSSMQAREQRNVRAYVLRLIRAPERTSTYLERAENILEKAAPALPDPLLERARELGLTMQPISFVSTNPAQDICLVAENKRVNLVLLGWHRPLLGHAVLGGTVYQVMTQATSDVGILFDRGLTAVRRVLVPYSGGSHDKVALRLAHRMNTGSGASVTVLHVVDPHRSAKDPRLGAKEKMDSVFTQASERHGEVTFKVVEHINPIEAALTEVAGGYDLVVIGAGEEWGLEQRRFGLQPEVLIQRCPTSLLVVRGRQGA